MDIFINCYIYLFLTVYVYIDIFLFIVYTFLNMKNVGYEVIIFIYIINLYVIPIACMNKIIFFVLYKNVKINIRIAGDKIICSKLSNAL